VSDLQAWWEQHQAAYESGLKQLPDTTSIKQKRPPEMTNL
jgi:hypothetical protein